MALVEMKIILLGTAGAIPSSTRKLISTLIVRDGELFFFDAGEGMQQTLMNLKIGLNKTTRIFITHMHGDHIFGLLGLIQTMSLLMRDKPIYVYGPSGIKKFLKTNIKNLGIILNFPLLIQEIKEGLVIRTNEFKIYAKKGNHSRTNFAFTLKENNRPGIFYPTKAKKLCIPEGKKWSVLQKGKQIRFNKQIIKPNQVLGKSRPGRKIGISGDTRPTTRLIKFFLDCDVLIHESTYSQQDRLLAKDRFHSTSVEAAQVAKKSKTNLLILTHFSSRYNEINSLEKEARQIHHNTIAGNDLMSFILPYPNEKRINSSYVLAQSSQ